MINGTLDIEAVVAHLAEAGDGPVVMVNLMKFKSPQHAQRFLSGTQERVAPLFQRLGAQNLYAGRAGPEFCAGEDWDFVLIVRYPSFEVVHRAATDETIGPFMEKLREDTLDRAQLIVTTPVALG